MTARRAFLRALIGSAAAAPLVVRFRAIDEAFARSLPDLGPGRLDPEALRDRYMLAPEITYLNHASIGTVPKAVHDARVALQVECETNPWLYIFGGGWEEAREVVRADAARLIGCPASDLAITHNTTEGFNVLARGLPLGRGDEVLFPSTNHDGASVCWRHASQVAGYGVREFHFPLADVPGLSEDDVVSRFAAEIRAETRVLVFPHIDNMVGLRYPMARLARMAHERGVEYVLVDGAQAAGMIEVDVAEAGVEGYAASPHKWIQAPKGLGLLYLSERVRRTLRPMWVTWGQRRWEGTVRVFEDYGTRDMPEVLALGDAVRFQETLGLEAKTAAYRSLRRHLQEAVEATAGLTWRSPRRWPMGAALVAVEPVGLDPEAVRQRLYEERGVVLRAFATPDLRALRVSPNVATTTDELDGFLASLAR